MIDFKKKFSKDILSLPWYNELLPEIDDVIIGEVVSIDENDTVNIKILNYNNINGIIATSELSRKRIKTIKSILKVGDIKPFVVTNTVDKDGLFGVDLSYKNIDNFIDEINLLEKYYVVVSIMFKWFKSTHNLVNLSKLEDDSDFDSEKTKNIPFNIEDWKKLMELTIWQYDIDVIYDKFLDIKIEKTTLDNIFPELYSLTEDSFTNIKISEKDISKLFMLINTYINYDITITVKLELLCWSVNSLDKIKEIIQNLTDLPKDFYKSEFVFSNLVINSPTYEFIIKSSNKVLIDKLLSSFETTFDNILKKYKDIEYKFEINREDKF